MYRERGKASLENSSLHSDSVSSDMFFALYYSLVVCIGSRTWWCQASNPSLHSSGGWQNWSDYDDRHLTFHCVHLVDDKTGQTDEVRHLIVHCVHLVDDESGQTDVRHLIVHCVHRVDGLFRLMTGIWLFIVFIWWMTKLVRLWWQASNPSLYSCGWWWTG